MKIALLDNYDSFTFNLKELLSRFVSEVQVIRNDQFDLEELYAFDAIIISPGPGKPSDAGLIKEVVRQFHKVKPILGICLGMQAIAEELGASLQYLDKPIHGKSSEIEHTQDRIFQGIRNPFLVGRYHSIAVNKTTLPHGMKEIASSDDGVVMAVKIKNLPVYGLQFHPESILTADGETMISNFIQIAKKSNYEDTVRKAI